MLTFFNTIHECDGHPDRQTDTQTDGQTQHDGVGRACSMARLQSRFNKMYKKLRCRREIARCFVSLNIFRCHPRSLFKVIRNDTRD